MTLGALLFSSTAVLADSVYCPQNAGYINIGMTTDQVTAACGQPLSKQQPTTPIVQKIPVQQFIYKSIDTGSIYPGLNSAFFNQWSLPSGVSPGVSLRVDVINNKVSGIVMNGSSTNAMSICSGVSIEAGDPVSKVYNACGSPWAINNTYNNQLVQSTTKPEVWIYQIDRYHPPMSLTFVDGKLQSIN